MAKDETDFRGVAYYDEFDPQEEALKKRRIETYSPAALKVGLRVDSIAVLYTDFATVLKGFDRIFQIAPQVQMPHGFRLVGPTGSGKTMLARYFEESLPRSTLFDQGFGCTRVTIGTTPSAGHVIHSVLTRCGYPFVRKSEKRAHWQQGIACEVLREKGTRVLVFDRADRLVAAAQWSRSRDSHPHAAAQVICDLMDELSIGVVLMGEEPLNELATLYPDLAARVPGRYELKNFAADAKWQGYLRSFAKTCTWFDLSFIDSESVATLLQRATGGNLRCVKRLLTETVLVAAQAGAKAATIEHAAEALRQLGGPANPAGNPFASASNTAAAAAA